MTKEEFNKAYQIIAEGSAVVSVGDNDAVMGMTVERYEVYHHNNWVREFETMEQLESSFNIEY